MSRSRLRSRPKRPPLTIDQILAWADNWFAAHGCWPNVNSGLIPGTIDDTWRRIDDSLRKGHRGLREKSGLTLARLLEKRRGVRNSEYPPPCPEAESSCGPRSTGTELATVPLFPAARSMALPANRGMQ